ncbi:hypothetical protein COCVIDRAFT_103657, partial [Bipolaris victoriae FI3]
THLTTNVGISKDVVDAQGHVIVLKCGTGMWLETAKRPDMFGADHHNSKEPTLVATSDSNILLTALDNTLCRGDHHLHASKLLTK